MCENLEDEAARAPCEANQRRKRQSAAQPAVSKRQAGSREREQETEMGEEKKKRGGERRSGTAGIEMSRRGWMSKSWAR